MHTQDFVDFKDSSRLFLSVLLVDKVFKGDHELSSEPPESVAEFLHSRNSTEMVKNTHILPYFTQNVVKIGQTQEVLACWSV